MRVTHEIRSSCDEERDKPRDPCDIERTHNDAINMESGNIPKWEK